MTNPYRAMCAELVELSAPVDSVPQLAERLQKLSELAHRARALLAQPELVAHQDKLDRLIALDRAHPEPKGEDCPGCEGTPVASNSPCAVCGRAQPEPVAEEPTDEELLRVAASAIAPYKDCGIAVGQYEPEAEPAMQVYGSELIAYARAALARFGRPTPQPPADGEVTELVEWLQSMRDLAGEHNPDEQRRYTRAAELLERPTSQPVAVSERLPEPGDCDDQGRCWLWERDCGYTGRKWALVDRAWSLSQSDEDLSVYTHWLPANALPTPEAKP